MSKTIDFARIRLREEEERAEQTGDYHDAVYWAAYLDGATALEKEFKCFKKNDDMEAIKKRIYTDIDFEFKAIVNAFKTMMPSYSNQAFGAIRAYKRILKFLGEEVDDRVRIVGEFIIPEGIEINVSSKLEEGKK